MTEPAVLVEPDAADAAVAVITLNRPQRRNALTVELKEALLAAVTGVAEDRGGAGGGADRFGGRVLRRAGPGRARRGAAGRGRAPGSTSSRRSTTRSCGALAGMRKPVVVGINGACAGAGLGIALAGDLRVAAAGARVRDGVCGVGLAADSGLAAWLVHALGGARAAELLLLGEPFRAEQAAQWGLVRWVVTPEQVLDGRTGAGPPAGRRPDRGLRRDQAGAGAGRGVAARGDAGRRGAAQARLGQDRGPHRGGGGVPGQAAPDLRGCLMTALPLPLPPLHSARTALSGEPIARKGRSRSSGRARAAGMTR